jgi:hypothetical protein
MRKSGHSRGPFIQPSKMFGDQDLVIVIEAECTTIEKPVVQHAQCNAILFTVRTARGVPLNMGGIESDRRIRQASTESAERAPMLIDA